MINAVSNYILMFSELSLLAPILADIAWANTLIFWLNFIAVASWICFDNYFLCPARMQVKSRLELGLRRCFSAFSSASLQTLTHFFNDLSKRTSFKGRNEIC